MLDALSQYARGVRIDFGLLLVIFLTFAPTMDCLLIGQDSVLVLLVYTLVFVALKRNREFAAGCLLACGLFKFHLVLPFAIIFLLRRRWSFVLGFSTIASLLFLLARGIGAWCRHFLSRNVSESQTKVASGLSAAICREHSRLIFLLTNGRIPDALPAY